MSFWDSSAILPLITEQQYSETLMNAWRDDIAPIVWWTTQIECASALCRLEREKLLTAQDLNACLANLDALRAVWAEVLPTEAIAATSRRLLRVHPLRSADALQLTAALQAGAGDAAALAFVCLDRRLRDAATREGFSLVPQTLEQRIS